MAKRVKKEIAKDTKNVVVETKVQPTPKYRDYIKAAWQLALNWIKTHKLKTVLGLVVFVLLIGTLAVLLKSDPAAMTNDDIVVRVSRELNISGDSNPAILTVEDETKVSQPFLEEAKNGDKVLLYYKSSKSVLFRPSENRIVRSGTFTPPDAKVFIRQGTNDGAKVELVKEQISKITDIEIVSKDYSTNRLNDKTIVVNVTDRYPEQAQAVADALGAELVRLPRGETIPDADILVIVGQSN